MKCKDCDYRMTCDKAGSEIQKCEYGKHTSQEIVHLTEKNGENFKFERLKNVQSNEK